MMKKSCVHLLVWHFSILSLFHLVHSTCPSACFCDVLSSYVNCVGDGLWQVPPDIPSMVTRLELRNYVVITLSSENIGYLTNLTELKLQQTQIQAIENGTFENLVSLERLDLSQNVLENVSSATFVGLISLKYLDLSSNHLSSISEAFMDLINVEQLNLRDNEIPQLTSRSFTGLNKVQYLNLDSNHIASMDVGTFQYLINLVHLILSNNPLTTLTRLDFFSSRLLYIDVSHVGLVRVPQSLTQVVRDLRLAKNNLTHIHLGDFDSYPHLGLLVLDDNFITDIENDALGRQESLLRLWLNGNQLRRVPSNLPPTLRILYIEENQLDILPAYSFQGLTNVEQLFLQRNRLSYLATCAFCDLINLRNLDLQSNLIENLTEGVFANLSKLEVLDLSQNPIRTLGAGCFKGLDSLQVLKLSRLKTVLVFDETIFSPLKKLETLELYDTVGFAQQVLSSVRSLHSLRNIRELNIMHNNLVNLRSDFPHFFPQLKTIKMSGNKWHCDRNILWLMNWIKRSEIQFYRSYSIRCLTPEDMHHKPIMMLTEQDFPNLPTTKSIFQPKSLTTALTTVPSLLSSTLFTTTTITTEPISDTALSSSILSKAENVTTSPFIPEKFSTVVSTAVEMITIESINISSTVDVEINNVTNRWPQENETTPSLLLVNSSFATSISPLIPLSEEFSEKPGELSAQEVSSSTVGRMTADNASIETENMVQKVTSTLQSPEPELKPPNQQIIFITISTVICGIAFLLVVFGTLLFVCRYRRNIPGKKGLPCQMRRSSSISYYPHRDEVSIVTVSEGTVGLKTATHHGLGNKLYFVMENPDNMCDPIKEAFPEMDYYDLIPEQIKEKNVYNYMT